MRFARWSFYGAGIYGVLVLAPLFFLERTVAGVIPPAFNHPELFYGFLSAAFAWQVAFLIIGTNPARYRPIMVGGMLEKFIIVGAYIMLLLQGRAPWALAPAVTIDAVLGVLFVLSFQRARTA